MRSRARRASIVPANCPANEGICGIVETIFRQPEIEADAVDDRVIGEVQPSGETFYVRIGNLGSNADAAALCWDVGRHTGFRPAPAESLGLYQRGPRQSAEGTAVRWRRPRDRHLDRLRPPSAAAGSPPAPVPGLLVAGRKPAHPGPLPIPTANCRFRSICRCRPPSDKARPRSISAPTSCSAIDDSKRHFWLMERRCSTSCAAERFPDTVHVDDWEGGTKLPILFRR